MLSAALLVLAVAPLGQPQDAPVLAVFVSHELTTKLERAMLAESSRERLEKTVAAEGYKLIELEGRLVAYHETLFNLASFEAQLRGLKVFTRFANNENQRFSSSDLTPDEKQDVLAFYSGKSEYAALGAALEQGTVEFGIYTMTRFSVGDGKRTFTVNGTQDGVLRPRTLPPNMIGPESIKRFQERPPTRHAKRALPPDVLFHFSTPLLNAKERALLIASAGRHFQELIELQETARALGEAQIKDKFQQNVPVVEAGSAARGLERSLQSSLRHFVKTFGQQQGIHDDNDLEAFMDAATIRSAQNLTVVGFVVQYPDGRQTGLLVPMTPSR